MRGGNKARVWVKTGLDQSDSKILETAETKEKGELLSYFFSPHAGLQCCKITDYRNTR